MFSVPRTRSLRIAGMLYKVAVKDVGECENCTAMGTLSFQDGRRVYWVFFFFTVLYFSIVFFSSVCFFCMFSSDYCYVDLVLRFCLFLRVSLLTVFSTPSVDCIDPGTPALYSCPWEIDCLSKASTRKIDALFFVGLFGAVFSDLEIPEAGWHMQWARPESRGEVWFSDWLWKEVKYTPANFT